jgi:hypothetical protein
MIAGQPARNAPITVAVPTIPVRRLNACRSQMTGHLDSDGPSSACL